MPLGKVGMEGILDLFKLGSQLRRPDPDGSLPSLAEMGTATVSGSGAADDAPASVLVSSTTATASTDVWTAAAIARESRRAAAKTVQ